MLVSEGQGCPHVGQMYGVLGVPAAIRHVQVTHPKHSGVSVICVNGLVLREPHTGRRGEGKNDRERDRRKVGRKETLVGWRNMVFIVGRSHVV